jgi:hypothetical protein
LDMESSVFEQLYCQDEHKVGNSRKPIAQDGA